MADDASQLHAQAIPGQLLIDGKAYLKDAKGILTPVEVVNTKHLLEDELVRKVLGYAQPLTEQIARFRQHCFDDVDQFVALLEQEHGSKRGGTKGNLTFTSYDGTVKVQVKVADQIVFGAELQVAKGLIDEYLIERSADSHAEIRAIIYRAFNVEQAGAINRGELFNLLRLEIQDERWQRAMAAIRESMRVVGSKRYVNIYRRANAAAAWEAVSIDVASA